MRMLTAYSTRWIRSWRWKAGKAFLFDIFQPGKRSCGFVTDPTEAFRYEGKVVLPGRLKVARASIKFSEIRTRKWGAFTLSIGGSAARGLRFPCIYKVVIIVPDF